VTNDPRKKLVEAGYDELGERYAAWSARVEGDPRGRFLDDFTGRLAPGARVLDLGCGAGVPSTRLLAERFEVVGVDISRAQLRLARANVPRATFIHTDLASATFPTASFAGVLALYSLTHVPREEHAGLFHRIASWLERGGLFLATLASSGSPDWTEEWLGTEMFFSGHEADTSRALLRSAGFELLLDEVVEMQEPEAAVSFFWVLAQRV
jgi:cyclopropane fatty-acyl-phospholipid synthase-like methyltransferase